MSIADQIAHWERIIAGQGLTDEALLFAARQLQAALRERERCSPTTKTAEQVSQSI